MSLITPDGRQYSRPVRSLSKQAPALSNGVVQVSPPIHSIRAFCFGKQQSYCPKARGVWEKALSIDAYLLIRSIVILNVEKPFASSYIKLYQRRRSLILTSCKLSVQYSTVQYVEPQILGNFVRYIVINSIVQYSTVQYSDQLKLAQLPISSSPFNRIESNRISINQSGPLVIPSLPYCYYSEIQTSQGIPSYYYFF